MVATGNVRPEASARPRTAAASSPVLKVAHVITGLRAEGAQTMLAKLVSATRPLGVESAVVSLMDGGELGARLTAEGVPLLTLGMRAGVPAPGALLALIRWLRRERPDVVQSWMYHADLLAGLAAAVAGVPLVWGVHHADVAPGHVKRLTRLTRALCARLSGVLPHRIVCCGEAALQAHATLGYRAERMVVVENGFETGRFRPDGAARARIRAELALPADAPVAGLVARFHPDKDHATFVAAARRVAARIPGVHFVLAGDGVTSSNETLRSAVERAGIAARVRLLGRRDDVPAILAALDVLVSSSRAEAFPQVLGEALLCGVPCAATDCGDSRAIVGDAGRLVAPHDPGALAAAVVELLALPGPARRALGEAGRERIRGRYELRGIAVRYVGVWSEVVAASAAPGRGEPPPWGEGA